VKQKGTIKDSVHVCTNVESTLVVPSRVACCCSQQIPGSLQQPFLPSSRPTACLSVPVEPHRDVTLQKTTAIHYSRSQSNVAAFSRLTYKL